MASQIGTAYVQIVPSARGIQAATMKELSPQMVSVGKSSGTKMGGALVGMLGKYIGAAAIGETVMKAFTEGANLEQAIGGVETLYKKASDTVIKNADRAWKTAGISANEYMSESTTFAASLLNSLGGDTAKAAKYADMAITDMSDNANKMGTSMTDIQNAYQGFSKQNYTMLDNLKLGYGGTKTEMERLLIDAGKLTGQTYDINNLADVYDGIHAIQNQLSITGTTSKEAATTLEGSFNSMKASVSNFLGDLTMGRNINSSTKALADSFCTFFFDNLMPAAARIVSALPQAALTIIQRGIPSILKGLNKFVPQFYTALAKMVTNITNKLTGWLNEMGSNPQAAAAGLKLIGNICTGVLKGQKQVRAALWNGLKGILAAAGSLALTKAKGIGNNIVNGIKSSITGKIQSIKKKITSIFPIKIGKILKGIRTPSLKLNSKTKKFGKLGSITYPTGFRIHWNAEGGIYDSPTVLQGVGEAGPEAVVPLSKLWQKLDAIASNSGGSSEGGTLQLVINLDGQTIGKTAVSYINGQTLQFGTSPLSI